MGFNSGFKGLNRFLRLFPSIYNCSLPEHLFTKRVTQWIYNPSSRKSCCLTFTGIYFNPIFHRPFPQGVQIILQHFYFVFICDFRINYTVCQRIVEYSSRCSSKYHLHTLETVVGSKRSHAAHQRLLRLPWIVALLLLTFEYDLQEIPLPKRLPSNPA